MSEPLQFDKSEPGAAPAQPAGAGADPAEPTRLIVKVREPGYVPEGFEVRTRVDDVLFTAQAREADIAAAEADPNVESVERGRGLHLP